MYAVDYQIYEIGKDTCTVKSKLQQIATLATNWWWYESNLLQGNFKRYQMINIRDERAINDEKTFINFKGKAITESASLKILGITLNGRLNFNEHINSKCKKAKLEN